MGKMVQTVQWSWGLALIGTASVVVATALILAKLNDLTFHLISINLTSYKLNIPILNAEIILTVHVSNPNIVPIHYSSTIMSIFYEGSLLGSAQVEVGSQLEPCQKTDQLVGARRMKVLLRVQAHVGGVAFGGVGVGLAMAACSDTGGGSMVQPGQCRQRPD
jgi:hypothetical protein